MMTRTLDKLPAGNVHLSGPRGVVIGREYFYLYRITPDGRYEFHTHGYDKGDWEPYFKSFCGIA